MPLDELVEFYEDLCDESEKARKEVNKGGE